MDVVTPNGAPLLLPIRDLHGCHASHCRQHDGNSPKMRDIDLCFAGLSLSSHDARFLRLAVADKMRRGMILCIL